MIRSLLKLFGFQELQKTHSIPSAPDLLSPHQGVNLETLETASTAELCNYCDQYWNSFLDEDDSYTIDSRVSRRALEILSERGSESLAWAQERLSHPGYDAREECAYLLQNLAENNQLGNEKDSVAKALAKLAVTPPIDETKEAQAATAALGALAVIGGPECLTAIRQVLTSPDWDEDDHQWEAAEILSSLKNQPFMESDDPVEAAKSWLANHPDTNFE